MPKFRLLQLVNNPARQVVASFALLIALGTALLLLPIAVDGATGLGLEDALFMSTSATTVTGLATVDIATFSLFGELVLLGLIQIGGFGIMTIGSVLALAMHVPLPMRPSFMLDFCELFDEAPKPRR